MPPHKYVCYISQAQLQALERRLEARSVGVLVMGTVAVLAGLLWAVVGVPLQGCFIAIGVAAVLHALWCGVQVGVTVRKIRRLREEMRA